MVAASGELVERASLAFDSHEWEAVVALLEHETALDGRMLETLGEAARWAGRDDLVLPTLERAQDAFAREGNRRGGARVSMTLAREHWERGKDAVAMGCLRRAGALLDGLPECSEHAMLVWATARMFVQAGDADGLLGAAHEAREIARRVGNTDVEALTIIDRAHAHLARGDVAEGLSLVDEAMAFATGGSLDIQTAGTIYCSTLWSCRNLGEWRRAAEWTEVTMRWCDRVAVNGFPGVCRFHRAEVLRMRGELDQAEADARRAIDELVQARPRFAAWGYMELGEIHRRRGDFDAAEAAFTRSQELGFDPQPSWALARLQQGDLESARAMIERTLESAPIMIREAGIATLPVAVSIACELGRLEHATALSEQLTNLADQIGTAHARAAALDTRAELQLASLEFDGALESLQASASLWSEIDAPYEEARCHLFRARVHHARGDALTARAELQTAVAAFERLGARGEVESAQQLLTAPDVRGERVHATFVFVDMVDSTPLVESLGDEAWAALLSSYERALRRELERFGGYEANKEGDGFFVTFTDPTAALDFACAVQEQLAERRARDGSALRVRIGLHAADAHRRGHDYSGLGVHVAARVSSAAAPDEILASCTTLADDRRGRVVTDRRALTLKGVSDPLDAATVVWR
ncbi:MAG TPA: adenylate/guanylate cyclase domain-containing protein [Acidimicrobiia bacterium]